MPRHLLRWSPAIATVPLIAMLLAAPAEAADITSTSRVTAVKLRAEGARVRVLLAVTCPTGASVHLDVTVTEANGTRIAQGTGRKDAVCAGTEQSVAVKVPASAAGASFQKGPATARTVRTVCDDTGCTITPFDETVRVTG